jgi:hypothetical protein
MVRTKFRTSRETRAFSEESAEPVSLVCQSAALDA